MSLNSAVLATNLLNPATLCFCLGVTARFVRSEFAVPKDVFAGISIFLLFSIGLKGGYELSQAPWISLVGPAVATLALGIITPLVAFVMARMVGRLSVSDSAGIAAHYGSVSVVTFIAAQNFILEFLAKHPNAPALEGYMPTLVALLESPGITVALLLGVLLGGSSSGRSAAHSVHEVLTGRTMFLLLGGLVVGSLMGHKNWESVSAFFDPRGAVFRGLLCIFLLEMGISAAARLSEVKGNALFMIGFGVAVPVINSVVGTVLGHAAGLSAGGAALLATMAASASYIAAPPAVKATLPEANPAYYLTLALAITFPFNIIFGIPFYFEMVNWYYSIMS